MPVKYVKWLVDTCLNDAPDNKTLNIKGCYQAGAITRILVLEYGKNPSTDYYIKPRISSQKVNVAIVDISVKSPLNHQLTEGTFIIIVRYLTRNWGNHLLKHRHLLRGVALFMDDDLPAGKHSPQLPLHYRHKLHRLFERQLDQLNVLCSLLWVSTPYLAERYAHCSPCVLPPLPLCLEERESTPLVYFYHGSAAHQAEIAWLHKVVTYVQNNTHHLSFIIIGSGEVNQLYKNIPRTMILHPMSWNSYCHSLAALPHHIGLVPLLPDSFNKGRSHTKFFDLTRLGSVGIYSDTPPYNQFIRDGVDGILLKNDIMLWATAIISLSQNTSRRSELLRHAHQRVEKMRFETIEELLDNAPATPQ